MFSHTPSLPAVRSFEAAARLGSFKAAADELSVSPTAISHQVRALEDQLGVALFIRKTRAVVLTDAGMRLARAAFDGLTSILDAVEEIQANGSIVRVTTIPAFAAMRLAPAIGTFSARHPEFSVEIDMTLAATDLHRDRRFDVAVRYGNGPYPGLAEFPLIDEKLGAYAAPSLAAGGVDLHDVTLIETAWTGFGPEPVTWAQWFARTEEPPPSVPPRRFDEELFVIQTAIAGQGVALLSNALTGDLVARGLLTPVRPEITVPGLGYRALCLPERSETRKVSRFLAWLQESFADR